MLLGGDEFLMKHKIIRDDQFSKYRFSSLIREELARRLEKNLDQLTAEDMQQNEIAKQIQLDKIMIMLIESPQQLWKHLNAKVKNAWMERIVIRKRVFKNLLDGFSNISQEDISSEIEKKYAPETREQPVDAADDQPGVQGDTKTEKSENLELLKREKLGDIFYEHSQKILKKWAKKKSFEAYLHKNLLLNLDVKKPLKILEKSHFKSLVKITFKVYFVQQVYQKEIQQIENRRKNQAKGSDSVTVSSDSTSSGSINGSGKAKLKKRSPNGAKKRRPKMAKKRQRLRTLDD